MSWKKNGENFSFVSETAFCRDWKGVVPKSKNKLKMLKNVETSVSCTKDPKNIQKIPKN